MTIHRASTAASLICSTLFACTVSSATKGAEYDTLAEKADGANLREHTESIISGTRAQATLTAGNAEAWFFTLTNAEAVTLSTFAPRNEEEIDTVAYLYKKQSNGWGRFIAKNDDASDGTSLSTISRQLVPGEYRVIVKGFGKHTAGRFELGLACADGSCEAQSAEQPTGAVIRLPVVDDDGALLSRFNAQLSEAGLPTFPDFVDLSMDDAPSASRLIELSTLAEREDVAAITNRAEVIVPAAPFGMSVEGEGSERFGLCYTGDGARVAGLIGSFAGDLFTEMLFIPGWRAGQQSGFEDEQEGPEESLGEELFAEWQSYDTASTDVLVVWAADDDGNANIDLVPRCAPASSL